MPLFWQFNYTQNSSEVERVSAITITAYDIWLSGEIYAKCKMFMLQQYYIIKVWHLSRSIQWLFPHLKQLKQKPTAVVSIPQQKMSMSQ